MVIFSKKILQTGLTHDAYLFILLITSYFNVLKKYILFHYLNKKILLEKSHIKQVPANHTRLEEVYLTFYTM